MTDRRSPKPFWQTVGTRMLPFADAASEDLPLARLLRLSLFQVSIGIAAVLFNGTLNRVLIVELNTPTWIVALMISIPLLVAPFRALIGYRSDMHRSVLGWRRVPYIWFGTLAQFGGLAIMPFSLILTTRADTFGMGVVAACLSFLLTGGGMHVTQTAGLALATDLASDQKRPRVVALLYVMLLIGMMIAAFTIGNLLRDFSATRLIQVIQGAALITIVLNVTALWKQEPRNTALTKRIEVDPRFVELWVSFTSQPGAKRLLCAIGIGALAFSMQDALLEPYGGEVLKLSVGSTTALTGVWAIGALFAFALCARRLAAGADPLRLAGFGAVMGVIAFLMILFAAPLSSLELLYAGASMIGFGSGLFSVGTMIAAIGFAKANSAGLALGVWGAVQATCAGVGVALGGLVRDGIAAAALNDLMGTTLASRATGYGAVYGVEAVLLLFVLVVLGPITGLQSNSRGDDNDNFGLIDFPI